MVRSHLGLRSTMNSQSPAALYSPNFQAYQPGINNQKETIGRKFSQGSDTLISALAFRMKVFLLKEEKTKIQTNVDILSHLGDVCEQMDRRVLPAISCSLRQVPGSFS